MTTDLKLFGKIIALPPALKEEALKYIHYLQFSQNQEVPDKKIKKHLKRALVRLILSCLRILMLHWMILKIESGSVPLHRPSPANNPPNNFTAFSTTAAFSTGILR